MEERKEEKKKKRKRKRKRTRKTKKEKKCFECVICSHERDMQDYFKTSCCGNESCIECIKDQTKARLDSFASDIQCPFCNRMKHEKNTFFEF